MFWKVEVGGTPKWRGGRSPYGRGMHAPEGGFKRRVWNYNRQLREKQKARRIYGVMERQFRRYFSTASRAKGLTGATLLTLLESRLDNVVYRLGFADSRAQARQLVRHGHFAVNNQKTDIPSFLVKPGDVVAVRDSSRNNVYFKGLGEYLHDRSTTAWLSRDTAGMSGRVIELPGRLDIDAPLNEQLIVEFYSR